MANTNPSGVVAAISTAALVSLWGDQLKIKRSKREDAKFPLYLSTASGPVHLNTAKGQDFLLENGIFHGANNPLPAETPEETPEITPETPPETPPEDKAPLPKQKHRDNDFFGWLNSGEDSGL